MIGASREERPATNDRGVAIDHLAAGSRGERLEGLAIGQESRELVGRGLGGPAGLVGTDLGAVGGGRLDADAIRAGLSWDVGGRVGAGLAVVGRRVERQFRPSGSVILSTTRALSSGRYSASRTLATTSTAGLPASVPARISASTRPGTSPTSQRTVCRQERSRSSSTGSLRCRPHRQRSPIRRAATCPLPNGWATSAGAVSPAASLTWARTDAPGLIAPTGLSVWNGGISASRLRSSSSVFRVRTQGWSQPSRVSTRRSSPADVLGLGRPVEVDRQQLADGRAVVLAVGERVGPAEHQQPAAASPDEVAQERELVLREEAGLEVVEDDGVVAVKLVGGLREAVAQLDLVATFQPDQHRLIGPFGGLGVGRVEPVEEG